jgi:hypothetical protein
MLFTLCCKSQPIIKAEKPLTMAVPLLSLLLLLVLAEITLVITGVITVVQFEYALAAKVLTNTLYAKDATQHVHPVDLINSGPIKSSPGHVENTEEEFKLNTGI